MALLPDYYIMDLGLGMAETVAPHMPSTVQIAANAWLPDDELAVYTSEFARTGLQGGLQWYRCQTDGRSNGDLQLYAGRSIDVPSVFIAGRADWGPWQSPGALEAMRVPVATPEAALDLIVPTMFMFMAIRFFVGGLRSFMSIPSGGEPDPHAAAVAAAAADDADAPSTEGKP